jgi:hypothetical protein
MCHDTLPGAPLSIRRRPRLDAVGWQAFHAAVLVVMAAFLAARWWTDPARRPAAAVRDNVALFWVYAAAQGLVAAPLVQGAAAPGRGVTWPAGTALAAPGRCAGIEAARASPSPP